MNSIKLKIAAGLAAVSVVSLGAAVLLNKRSQKTEAEQSRHEAFRFFNGYTVYVSQDDLEGLITIENNVPRFTVVNFTVSKFLNSGTLGAQQALQQIFGKAMVHALVVHGAKPQLPKEEIFKRIVEGDFNIFSIELTK